MKRFIFVLLCFPILAFGQTLSNGEDFVVDDSRVTQTDRDINDPFGLNSQVQTEEEVAPSANETLGDAGKDLGASGGFSVTQQGGLDGVNNAMKDGKSVEIMGLAMGASYAAICATPHNKWACPLAAMSFADALTGSSAQSSAYKTGAKLDPTFGSQYSSDFNENGETIYQAQAEQGLQDMAAQGYVMNADGSVTTPEGESISANDYGSAKKLQAKGFTPSAAQKAMQGQSSVIAQASKETATDLQELADRQVASAGSGGSSSGSAFAADAGAAAAIGGVTETIEYRKRGKNKKRLPSSEAAQLSKNFNGDPIGIGIANLFLIVHQKYKEKKNKKTEFINREY